MILYDGGFFLVHAAMMDWEVSDTGTMIEGFAIATSEGDEEFPFFE